jgi:hypothetical protein
MGKSLISMSVECGFFFLWEVWEVSVGYEKEFDFNQSKHLLACLRC